MELIVLSNMLHKLRCVESKLVKKFEVETGFSLTRYEILIFLKEHGDKLLVDIADYLEIDPAAVTRHIKILETKGYVLKKRNKLNGREVIISLSDIARAGLEECRKKQADKPCSVAISIDETDVKQLNALLEKIEANLK